MELDEGEKYIEKKEVGIGEWGGLFAGWSDGEIAHYL